MARKKIETIILEKIYPYVLLGNSIARVAQLVRDYPYDLLVECIDIGAANYLKYDISAELTKESVQEFINKLGGIAYNRSLSPIDQELSHILNKAKKICTYWDNSKATIALASYVNALRQARYSDEMILKDLQTEMARLTFDAKNWSSWYNKVIFWTDEINHWSDKDTTTIEQAGAILPDTLFKQLHNNIQLLCKQINASYEKNLFDCTAVMMRRLLEGLLVQSYQFKGIEDQITDAKSGFHYMLDKIIKNAEINTALSLSANTKKGLAIFKDLGNYSAHKIWYNCTKQDLEPHLFKYRVIIEELLNKSGLV